MNTPLLIHGDVTVEHADAGVRNVGITLCDVTSGAGIEEIIVITRRVRLMDLRSEVIKMVGCSHDTPLLAFETVHTAKGKLIPQPRTITLVLRIACWAMPAQVRSARIDEGYHRRSVGCSLAWRSNC